jgi:SAM-dependent methyltransferase
MGTYVLDNAAEQTGQRFASLEACYDPVTTRQLQAIGVADGWSSLEVGAGNGSIARRLAELAAPDGHVVATDIDPRWIDAGHSNIELRRHDVAADELERDTFDLAHTRLVLSHLPDRDRALRRMIESLKPGGWLLIEDFDAQWLRPMAMGEPADIALADKVMHAFRLVIEQAGVDLGYGRRCSSLRRERGLIDVHVDAHIEIAPGGSPGARLMRSNVEQHRERLTGLGLVSRRDLRCYCELLENPEFSFSLPPMVCGRGRRAPELSARRPESG